MSGYTCPRCVRTFGGLTGFDKHQEWDYGNSDGPSLICNDPARMLRRNGSHMFKLDDRGRWVLLVGKAHPHA